MSNNMLKCQFCSFTSKLLKSIRSHEKVQHFYTSGKTYNVKKCEKVKNLSNPSLKNNHFGNAIDEENVPNMIDI